MAEILLPGPSPPIAVSTRYKSEGPFLPPPTTCGGVGGCCPKPNPPENQLSVVLSWNVSIWPMAAANMAGDISPRPRTAAANFVFIVSPYSVQHGRVEKILAHARTVLL